MARKIWPVELIGVPVIVVFGSLLHFTFGWAGYWSPVALVAAVNESVWEHLKIAFWPGLMWSILELVVLRPNRWQFWAAKGFALLIAPAFIVIAFYAYTSLLGRNLLALDITTFVVAIALGQIVSARLISASGWRRTSLVLGTTLLTLQLIAYSTFTFYPPALGIFEDSRDGNRGISSEVTRQK